MTALLIADHDNVKLRPATASAVTALLQMTEAVDVLVAGNGGENRGRPYGASCPECQTGSGAARGARLYGGS